MANSAIGKWRPPYDTMTYDQYWAELNSKAGREGDDFFQPPVYQRCVTLPDGRVTRLGELLMNEADQFLREEHEAALNAGLYDNHDLRNLIIDALEERGFGMNYAETTIGGELPESETGVELNGRKFRVVIQWTNAGEC